MKETERGRGKEEEREGREGRKRGRGEGREGGGMEGGSPDRSVPSDGQIQELHGTSVLVGHYGNSPERQGNSLRAFVVSVGS